MSNYWHLCEFIVNPVLFLHSSSAFFLVLTVAHLSPTLSPPLILAFLPDNTMRCCVCDWWQSQALWAQEERPADTHTHTQAENLWPGLSHRCPLSINILAQTSSFTPLNHQTGFCLSLHNNADQHIYMWAHYGAQTKRPPLLGKTSALNVNCLNENSFIYTYGVRIGK